MLFCSFLIKHTEIVFKQRYLVGSRKHAFSVPAPALWNVIPSSPRFMQFPSLWHLGNFAVFLFYTAAAQSYPQFRQPLDMEINNKYMNNMNNEWLAPAGEKTWATIKHILYREKEFYFNHSLQLSILFSKPVLRNINF